MRAQLRGAGSAAASAEPDFTIDALALRRWNSEKLPQAHDSSLGLLGVARARARIANAGVEAKVFGFRRRPSTIRLAFAATEQRSRANRGEHAEGVSTRRAE